jgi:hypothetical protein
MAVVIAAGLIRTIRQQKHGGRGATERPGGDVFRRSPVA